MAKLSPTEYKSLRGFLNFIFLPQDCIKAALSAANQRAVYQHYLDNKDIEITTAFSSFKIPFSRFADQDDTPSQDTTPPQEPVLPVPPPKTKTKAKTGYSVRLDDDEREELQKIADSFDVPLAQVLRWAVKDYLVNKRKTT